jgi:hypothetical protein
MNFIECREFFALTLISKVNSDVPWLVSNQ